MEKLKNLWKEHRAQCIAAILLLVLTPLVLMTLIGINSSRSRSALLRDSMDFDLSGWRESQTVVLTGAFFHSTQDVWDGLTVSPAAGHEIESLGDGSFAITLLTVEKDQPYTITFKEKYGGAVVETVVNDGPLKVSLAVLNPGNFGIEDQIALQFSHEIREQDLKQHLSIEPQIGFELICRGEMVYIRPHSPLAYQTTYTIHIDENMPNLAGDKILELPAELELTTESIGFTVKLINPSTRMYTRQDEISLRFNAFLETLTDVESVPMEITLYRFPDLDDYLARSEKIVSGQYDLDGLTEVESFTHALLNQASTFVLSNPGDGAYILDMRAIDPETGNEFHFRKAVAVTSLSLYAQTSGTQTLLWLNDSVSGNPLKDYRIVFMEDDVLLAEATTDADGIAMLSYVNTAADSYYYYGQSSVKTICLYGPEGELVYADNTSVLNRYQRPMRPNRYYTFLMTDRPIYRPTDEIQFWGVVRSWQGNADPLPENMRILLGDGTLDQSIEITPAADGSFQGRFEIEMARSSYYSLELRIPEDDPEYSQAREGEPLPERTLASEYIQVQDYQKPVYTISTSTDKDFYMPGEDVTVVITPTFYDGTPMPYFDLELMLRQGYYGDYSDPIRLTTDAEGKVSYTFTAIQTTGRVGWLPAWGGYMVKISEDGEAINHFGEYLYLPSDTIAAGRITKQADNKLRLSVQTAALNQSRLKTREDIWAITGGGQYYYDSHGYSEQQFNAAKGGSLGIPVQVKVSYSWYEPAYEWIDNPNDYSTNQVRRWVYHHDTREFEVNTVNGVATIEDLAEDIPYDAMMYFSMDISLEYTDSKGSNIATSLYWYNNGWYPGEENLPTVSPGFNFQLTDKNGKSVLGKYEAYLSYNEAAFGDGDTMNFQLYYQDKPHANNGRILYTILQQEIVSKDIITSDTLQLTQDIANANSFNLVAAYFDGTTVYPIRNTVITFDKSSIALDVGITSDKEAYHPGDTVELAVKVTDPKGAGVQGIACISIVDESIFALREQDIDVMYDLYRDFFFDHYYVPKYATGHGDFIMEYGMGAGGKGDGAELTFQDRLRKNFRDTALFRLVRTDANGLATTSFTLPDNVTSWRVTGVAVGDNMYAGQSKTNFVSTMPFFVRPVISSKYIDGDDIALLVQGHGVALDENSRISYSVRITGDGVDQTLTATEAAYRPVQLNFGKLPQGEYTVTAAASIVPANGGTPTHIDAVELPLAVIKSNLELVITRQVDLSKPLELSAMRYPVTLTLYDKTHEPYYRSISSLLTHYCMMSNQRMSRFVAKRALTQHMDPESIPQHIRAEDNLIAQMQNPDGGIGSGLNQPSHPAITTKVLLLARDQFQLGQMTAYFNSVLAETKDKDNIAASYLGLAVIGKDVTGLDISGKIHALLKKPDTGTVQQAYLIAALQYLGEEKEAVKYYDQLLTPGMKSSGDTRYHSGGRPDTAAVWIAASCLGHADADAISLYLAKSAWRIDTLFECMIYITHYDKEVLPANLSYKIGEEAVLLDLGLFGSRTVSFTKSEFQALSFSNLPENIAARAYFIGEPAEADIKPSEEIGIRREITPLDHDRYLIALTVDFNEGAPTGYYDISEWVPSNMRLYQIDPANRHSGQYWWYNYSTEGQKIYFELYRGNDTKSVTLSYIAQKTYDAEAVVDSAYIIHGESGINNLTERETIS